MNEIKMSLGSNCLAAVLLLCAIAVYHMNAHGRVTCLDAATGSELWALNVLLDGRLYLRYHDSLWCYDVRADEASAQRR